MQGVQGVERAAAIDAGVHVALGGAHLQVQHDQPAQPDGDRRRVLVDHPRVEDDRAVGAALVGAHPVRDGLAAGLLLALHEHAHVDRQGARRRLRARDVQQRQEVALVVGRAARVDAPVAHIGLEGRRRPRRRVADGLHVVVAVDEHRRRALARRAQLADGQRVAVGRHDAPLAARGATRCTTHAAARSRSAGSPPPVEIDGIRSQSRRSSSRRWSMRGTLDNAAWIPAAGGNTFAQRWAPRVTTSHAGGAVFGCTRDRNSA